MHSLVRSNIFFPVKMKSFFFWTISSPGIWIIFPCQRWDELHPAFLPFFQPFQRLPPVDGAISPTHLTGEGSMARVAELPHDAQRFLDVESPEEGEEPRRGRFFWAPSVIGLVLLAGLALVALVHGATWALAPAGSLKKVQEKVLFPWVCIGMCTSPGNTAPEPSTWHVGDVGAGNVGKHGWRDALLQYYDKCVGVDPNNIRNGSVVQLRPCNEGQNIRWKFETFGSWAHLEHKLVLMAADGKFCLDVKDHKFENGTPLQIWKCLYQNKDQDVHAQTVDKEKGFITMAWKQHPEFYLDVKDGQANLWQPVQIWTKGPNQVFGA